ncbi:MAG: 1-acyl-sn-glycerol-3-phosphate acyltransferase [Melioribacteraceae bacterium]|nr:1-acyl-sn-glycerol-3-phosphate acyltransferase [Melioribacteraceae bacterium]MCF8264731.1 1-acyl-sn-glycerol-3-phosphate acyltransferase [Melioribacteraceae bacterium]MCF8413171.1 1-acyl-sn-glycerol-3-phosphate acyltransferase [Melioribacteraceae bacterium]
MTDYSENIPRQDTYHTAPGKKKNSIFSPSFVFYRGVIKVVLESYWQAKNKAYDRYRWVEASLNVLRAAERAGIDVEITGMDNLRKFEGPAVFLGNHMSSLETMVLPALIQPVKPSLFVIKKELADFPFMGKVVMARDSITVGRANPREDLKLVMEDGSKTLKSGKSIIIFPQRTRNLYFEKKSFNTLGVKLAKRNGVPVVPFALVTDAWGTGKLIKDFGKIDISKPVKFAFGEHINIETSGNDENQQIINFIETKFIEWGKGEFVK